MSISNISIGANKVVDTLHVVALSDVIEFTFDNQPLALQFENDGGAKSTTAAVENGRFVIKLRNIQEVAGEATTSHFSIDSKNYVLNFYIHSMPAGGVYARNVVLTILEA